MPGVIETATRKPLAETIPGELRRGLLDRRDGSSPTTSGLPAGWCILSEQRSMSMYVTGLATRVLDSFRYS